MAVTILISVQSPESILTPSLNTNLHTQVSRIMVRPLVNTPTSKVLNSVLSKSSPASIHNRLFIWSVLGDPGWIGGTQ